MDADSVVITHARVGFVVTQSLYVTHVPVVTTVHSLGHLARVGRYCSSEVTSVLNLGLGLFVQVSPESHTKQISKSYLRFRLLLTEKKQTHKP